MSRRRATCQPSVRLLPNVVTRTVPRNASVSQRSWNSIFDVILSLYTSNVIPYKPRHNIYAFKKKKMYTYTVFTVLSCCPTPFALSPDNDRRVENQKITKKSPRSGVSAKFRAKSQSPDSTIVMYVRRRTVAVCRLHTVFASFHT